MKRNRIVVLFLVTLTVCSIAMLLMMQQKLGEYEQRKYPQLMDEPTAVDCGIFDLEAEVEAIYPIDCLITMEVSPDSYNMYVSFNTGDDMWLFFIPVPYAE